MVGLLAEHAQIHKQDLRSISTMGYLGREISDNVSSIASPKRNDTFILDSSGEAISNAFVGFRQPSGFDHLILILNQQLNSLNWSSCCFWDCCWNSSHEKIYHKSTETLFSWSLNKNRRYGWYKCQVSASTRWQMPLTLQISIDKGTTQIVQAIISGVHIGGKPGEKGRLAIYFLVYWWIRGSICHV